MISCEGQKLTQSRLNKWTIFPHAPEKSMENEVDRPCKWFASLYNHFFPSWEGLSFTVEVKNNRSINDGQRLRVEENVATKE